MNRSCWRLADKLHHSVHGRIGGQLQGKGIAAYYGRPLTLTSGMAWGWDTASLTIEQHVRDELLRLIRDPVIAPLKRALQEQAHE